MNPVEKALWYIESHFREDVTLDDVAAAGGLSRFAMSRAFPAATGHWVTGYLRARRLSEAARVLAAGAPDILGVALDAGYGSHQAFTRAFRDQFGLTPERVRADRHIAAELLTEPIMTTDTTIPPIAPPRLTDGTPLLIAGIAARHNCHDPNAIPAQWQDFGPHIGHIPHQTGDAAYGVVWNTDEAGNFEYLCGVEVTDLSELPEGFTGLEIAARRYAVFRHDGHIAGIRRTMAAIWSEGMPATGREPSDAPLFERYGPEFDPRTGEGGVEIWVPLRDEG